MTDESLEQQAALTDQEIKEALGMWCKHGELCRGFHSAINACYRLYWLDAGYRNLANAQLKKAQAAGEAAVKGGVSSGED